MENRNDPVSDTCPRHTGGTAERDAALAMLDRREAKQRISLGTDKGYDVTASSKRCADAG